MVDFIDIFILILQSLISSEFFLLILASFSLFGVFVLIKKCIYG